MFPEIRIRRHIDCLTRSFSTVLHWSMNDRWRNSHMRITSRKNVLLKASCLTEKLLA